MPRPIKIIDLFAGPGGLGEGFSAFTDPEGNRPFRVAASIEKEASAHKTLLLRAFYRQFEPGEAPKEYYEFLNGKLGPDPEDSLYKSPKHSAQIKNARREARQLELGKENFAINDAIGHALGRKPGPWVLIGGPPCQAYSLAGRVRNKGVKNYKAENDNRHFLYLEYLSVIARFKPSIFVMENVKGLLSASVKGEKLFERILSDLEYPTRAVKIGDGSVHYELHSLVSGSLATDQIGDVLSPSNYVVRSEKYGIPQARHRVILIGIRADIARRANPHYLTPEPPPSVSEIIGDLPRLRSGLSKERDSADDWINAIGADARRTIRGIKDAAMGDLAETINQAVMHIKTGKLGRGSNWNTTTTKPNPQLKKQLRAWYLDERGWDGVCNHETRSHIREDLQRYLFCASFGTIQRDGVSHSPTSSAFPRVLAPNHANWNSGDFADRYRVQIANEPAKTITSHISKDGHYFIHYDPTQCRSLTVREAARIQTFPDNYFFVGSRTEQYVQVGNAVPPFLASKIAAVVHNLLTRGH